MTITRGISTLPYRKLLHSCISCRLVNNVLNRSVSEKLEDKYTGIEKEKILKVVNDPDVKKLSRYDITKGRLKKIKQYVKNNGVHNISDIELIDGFSEKTAKKLFDSILNGPIDKENKIKGQILHPHLYDAVRQSCKTVMALYVTVNSVSWTKINKDSYEVTEWVYRNIDYPGAKKLQITDILDIAWSTIRELPNADVYVMQAEATTLRAGGSDPNNPKVISVNLQKAQLISMLVTLINTRNLITESVLDERNKSKEELTHKVYFLRPTLPYRLYGTLVGNERVATNQTVDILLQNVNQKCSENSHAYICEQLKTMFSSKSDLEKDMLGHCLLLGLTFMDLCIYNNQNSVNKLIKRK